MPQLNNTNNENQKDLKDIRTGDIAFGYYPGLGDLLKTFDIQADNISDFSKELKSGSIKDTPLTVLPIDVLAPVMGNSLEGENIIAPTPPIFYDHAGTSFFKSILPEFSHSTSHKILPIPYNSAPIQPMYNTLFSTPYSYVMRFQAPESYHQFFEDQLLSTYTFK